MLEDVRDSSFWTDLLLSPDSETTFVVLSLRPGTHRQTVRRIDESMTEFRADDFEVAASGVTYVAEHMHADHPTLVIDSQAFGGDARRLRSATFYALRNS